MMKIPLVNIRIVIATSTGSVWVSLFKTKCVSNGNKDILTYRGVVDSVIFKVNETNFSKCVI